MKKIIAILLVLAMALSLCACGDTQKEENNGGNPTPAVSNDQNNDGEVPDATDPEVTPAEAVSALDLLTAVWDAMPEDSKPMAFGGDYHEENQVENAPGIHSIETDEDAQSLDTNFGLPANMVSSVERVACIRHMLNANSFSCAAYEVIQPADSDTDNVQAVSTAIRDGLMNRAYMCGWPEQLEIISVGTTVVGFYGSIDIVGAFKEALMSLYGDTAVVWFEEDMSEAGGDNTFGFPVPNGDDPA